MINVEHQIIKMIEDGFAKNKITKILNISNDYLNTYLQNKNIKLQKEHFDETKINKIVDLYQQGVSAKNLGEKFSIDKRRVQKWVNKQGILRNKNDSHRITFWNDHVMDLISSPEQAYWLGFCYADAYNCQQTNTFSISLKQEDKEHLEKFAKFLSFPVEKITENFSFNKETDKVYPIAHIVLYSKHFCEIMAKHGCPQAKSFIIKYPEWIEEKLHTHFIRGLFDGDGCLTKRISNNEWKWSLTSTKECIDVIKKIVKDQLNIDLKIYYISKTNNNTYDISISGNEQIYKLMTWLYTEVDCNIWLDRKHNKYVELQKQQNNRSFERENYKVSDEIKQEIVNDLEINYTKLGQKYKLHPRTISKIKRNIK